MRTPRSIGFCVTRGMKVSAMRVSTNGSLHVTAVELVALKFTSEAERQEAVARHADLYQRARSDEITVAELERLSKACC